VSKLTKEQNNTINEEVEIENNEQVELTEGNTGEPIVGESEPTNVT
jgi:molecular chaperone GrpE